MRDCKWDWKRHSGSCRFPVSLFLPRRPSWMLGLPCVIWICVFQQKLFFQLLFTGKLLVYCMLRCHTALSCDNGHKALFKSDACCAVRSVGHHWLGSNVLCHGNLFLHIFLSPDASSRCSLASRKIAECDLWILCVCMRYLTHSLRKGSPLPMTYHTVGTHTWLWTEDWEMTGMYDVWHQNYIKTLIQYLPLLSTSGRPVHQWYNVDSRLQVLNHS